MAAWGLYRDVVTNYSELMFNSGLSGLRGFVVQRGGLRRDLGLLLKALAARRRHTVLVEI